MKKIFTVVSVVVFVMSFGIAYAGSGLYNGVTDFSGKAHDTFEIAPALNQDIVYESSAPGSKRLVEGPADSTRHIHDTFEISEQGTAKQGMTGNWAGNKSSVRVYDNFDIRR